MMKRALIATTALAAAAGLTWALWPSDEGGGSTPTGAAETSAAPDVPRPSLAEQLDAPDPDLDADAADAGLGAVTGVVQDEQGNPVPGAEVTLFAPHGGHTLDSATCPVCEQPVLECFDLHTAHDVIAAARAGKGQPKVLATTSSQADGTFRFDGVPQGELELTAKKGALTARGYHTPEEETALMLSTPARLGLRVLRLAIEVDAPGVALAGARVSAISLDTFRVIETVSDGSGHVTLDGLDEGNGVWVLLEAPGMLPHLGTVYSDQDDSEVALEPARALLVRTSVGGRPADAKVTVTGGGQHPVTQQTSGGQARFDGLGGDSYEAVAMTEGLVAPSQSILLEQDLTTIDLELRAAARLLVTVIDEAGEPVPNADVSAAGRAGDYHSGLSADGALVILGPLGEGPLTVDVTTTDFRPWHRELEVHPGDNALEVVVKKGVKITGRVLDPDGVAVMQAQVDAKTTPNDPNPSVAFTDGEGNFELTFDGPGPQELTAALTAVGRTTRTVAAPAEDVVIRLEPRARLKIFVHEGTRPVVGASVMIAPIDAEDDGAISAQTGVDGMAAVSGLDTANYQVVVQAPQFRAALPAQVALTDGRTTSIDVPMDRGLTLVGQVVDARGAPVPRADVQTTPWTTNTVTDEEGKFELTTLDPAAAYTLEATTDLLRSAPVAFKGPQANLRVVMQPRPLMRGRVVNGATGQPIDFFVVDSRTIESPDGTFTVPATVGTDQVVMVTIAADGFETYSWEGTVEQSRDLGTIKLGKAKEIDGIVRDARGLPVPGALVICDYTADEVTSAADGTFRLMLSSYEAGSTLTAQRNQLKGSAVIALGRLNEIVLSPPTKVSGLVLDGNGRGVAGTVTMRDQRGMDELQAEAGADGTFAVDLAPGRWLFLTRLSAAGQSVQIAGPAAKVTLGSPPGSCALSVQTQLEPDELILVPGESSPAIDTPLDTLAAIDGAVVFDTVNSRQLKAAGFRCGKYTLLARWGGVQKAQAVDVYAGPKEVQLPVPQELVTQ